MKQTQPAYTTPINTIQKAYPLLSETQKKIADLVLAQAETICFLRLEDFSKLAGVTTVTVIRFAKKLGYENFGAFKKDLQNYIQTMVIPMRIVKSELNDLRETPTDDIICRAIQNELELMQKTYDSISFETLFETAMLIKKARKIFIVGTGLNGSVAEILLTRLKFLCLDAQIICPDNLTLLPYTLVNAGEDDAFILFSFPNYKEFTINMAQCAQALGCHTICITDKLTAPIASYAEQLLLCQTSSLIYYNSMTAPTSLVTILSGILAVLIQKDAKTQERLDYIASFFQ
ncbi:MurR/RpiR family transcriptional regulator [Lachnospiraceae bacterium 45-P1]